MPYYFLNSYTYVSWTYTLNDDMFCKKTTCNCNKAKCGGFIEIFVDNESDVKQTKSNPKSHNPFYDKLVTLTTIYMYKIHTTCIHSDMNVVI